MRIAPFLRRAAVLAAVAGPVLGGPAGPAVAAGAPVPAGPARLCDGPREAAARGCGPAGTVHFAAGVCVVNLILPEGPDAPWDPAAADQVRAEVTRALDWWAAQSGGELSFVVVDAGVVPIAVEPGALPIEEEETYLAECLVALGYEDASMCAFTGLAQFNESERIRHDADWAYTQVVLNADAFPGSPLLAYSYRGGPHTVALQGNGFLSIDELDYVLTHEMGHIFQAADEYAGACSDCVTGAYGYLDAPNGNCTSCATAEGPCVMRGSDEYTVAQMHALETAIHPCSFTRRMVGLWDGNRNGILDVRETHPETAITTAVPDTLGPTEGFLVTGTAQDTPFPAPPRYAAPVTINRIRAVEFRIDDGPALPAGGVDGALTERQEEFRFRLPALGGGTHSLTVQAVNDVGMADPTPARRDFFVHDVRLAGEPRVTQDGAALEIAWRVDGDDLRSRFSVFRRRGPDGAESRIGTVESAGGRNRSFVLRDADPDLRAGEDYRYRLEVDIPGRGTQDLGTVPAALELAAPAAGAIVTVAPNPSRGVTAMSVTVPGRADGAGGPVRRDVAIAVFDVRGRRVRDLGRFREQATQRITVVWDGATDAGDAAPAGVYFVRVSLDDRESIEKLVRLR